MEAHVTRAVGPTAAKRFALLAVVLLASMGARHRTANFIVETDDPNFAKQVAELAEQYRRDLAVEWLGETMPNWWQPCVMTVNAGPNLGAGGATTFVFEHGEVFNWRMSIQGSRERILDSVLPHEITHMIFACHFRRPLPRWADEGGATSIEHASERDKYRRMLPMFLSSGRGIAFNQMVAIMEYPPDYMPLYAQGYSVVEFLIQTGGRRKFVAFLDDALKNDDWSGAIERNYGVKDLGALQNTWLAWVRQGSPLAKPRAPQPGGEGELLAAGRRPRPEPNLIYRTRNEEPPPVLTGELVPVRGSSRSTSTAVASNAPHGEPTVLPVAGWRAAGSSDSANTASAIPDRDPFSTQVAHPQPPEPQRQVILR